MDADLGAGICMKRSMRILGVLRAWKGTMTLFMQIPAPRSASIPREEDMHLASLSLLIPTADILLEGDYDLYGAIGLFGGVDFESCFDPEGWLWKE
jgi:hypothetical protein